jgi:hypothetical protein
MRGTVGSQLALKEAVAASLKESERRHGTSDVTSKPDMRHTLQNRRAQTYLYQVFSAAVPGKPACVLAGPRGTVHASSGRS